MKLYSVTLDRLRPIVKGWLGLRPRTDTDVLHISIELIGRGRIIESRPSSPEIIAGTFHIPLDKFD